MFVENFGRLFAKRRRRRRAHGVEKFSFRDLPALDRFLQFFQYLVAHPITEGIRNQGEGFFKHDFALSLVFKGWFTFDHAQQDHQDEKPKSAEDVHFVYCTWIEFAAASDCTTAVLLRSPDRTDDSPATTVRVVVLTFSPWGTKSKRYILYITHNNNTVMGVECCMEDDIF